ncbi:glycosyltransferase [Candidatus Saccharibacteria bacterium]|nr:glycosyltransferase [Candidatus Saccharibacteria bacterium]
MKVALVCDWLTNVGGAEKVLLEVHKLFPEAPIYTSKYDPKGISWFKDADIRTGWMQIFPATWRRILGPFRQIYFSHLNLSGYDLVISVTGAEAKAVSAPDGVHISYCHVPTQYYWQMHDEYIKDPGFNKMNAAVRFFFRLLVKPLRKADFRAAEKVDFFVTISDYAKELIRKYYRREATVIHPPVEISDFAIKTLKKQMATKREVTGVALRDKSRGVVEKSVENFYVVTSRQVTWKRLDLAIRACLELERPLLVIGEGPEHKKLVKMARGSEFVRFLPLMDKAELAEYLARAKGYLFPSLEPFGIAPVEALAAGCPVIAFREGGVRDYVKDGVNGVLFDKQNVKSLVFAMKKFEKMKFERGKVSRTAKEFDGKRFDAELMGFVHEKVK